MIRPAPRIKPVRHEHSVHTHTAAKAKGRQREETRAHLGQFLIKLRIRQRKIFVQIPIKHERKDRRHSIDRGVANHKPPLV